MAGKDPFQVEGRVIEAKPSGIWLAELANGHQLTAFAAGKTKKRLAGLRPGDTVRLQLTPYDLSVGRILPETET